MNIKDIVAAFLEFLKILVSWPVAFVIFATIFKKELRELLPNLAKRISKAPGGFEFATEGKALADALNQGIKELGDKPSEFADFAKNQVEKLAQSRSVAALVDRTSLAGKSILWVDDKPVNNTYEASSFKSMGARIEMVLSTSAALNALEVCHYDLIISDIRRFENGTVNSEAGYELLEALIKREIRVPVIFYTATIKTLNKTRTKAAFGIAHRSAELTSLVISVLSNQ